VRAVVQVLPATSRAPDESDAAGAWPGYLPEYGKVRKRRIKKFSCLEPRVSGTERA
jgi:hypothetical protein